MNDAPLLVAPAPVRCVLCVAVSDIGPDDLVHVQGCPNAEWAPPNRHARRFDAAMERRATRHGPARK